jgi:hypothetical protein
MSKKYYCGICNYETNRLSDYKKHLSTKKHKKNVEKYSTKIVVSSTKIVGKTTEIVEKKLNCDFCGQNFSRSDSLKRHQKVCKLKDKTLIEKEKKIYEEKNKLLEQKMKELELKNKQMEEEKNQILKHFNECLMKIWQEKTKPQVVNNINNINIEQLTIRYVRKHFTDAYNYEDLMEPLLTNEEIKLIEQSPINGCYELLKGRCIDDIDIQKRPIHLVDKSRNKYALRKDGQWITDKGESILKELDKKVSWLIKQYDLDNDTERDLQLNILQSVLSDKYKILDYLNDNVLLKDNAKLIQLDKKQV